MVVILSHSIRERARVKVLVIKVVVERVSSFTFIPFQNSEPKRCPKMRIFFKNVWKRLWNFSLVSRDGIISERPGFEMASTNGESSKLCCCRCCCRFYGLCSKLPTFSLCCFKFPLRTGCFILGTFRFGWTKTVSLVNESTCKRINL